MSLESIEKILKLYKSNKLKLEETLNKIKSLEYIKISNISNLDIFREKRTGVIEAVLAEGKNIYDLLNIIKFYLKYKNSVLVTRVNSYQLNKIKSEFFNKKLNIGKYKRTIIISNHEKKIKYLNRYVGLISAGTSDLIVIEEAKMTLHELGCKTFEINDIGVSGYPRLLSEINNIYKYNPDVLIVAAGREGTLPTLISSITDIPVIGIPVSSGYGFGKNGTSALYSMLQSCSVLSVVNIDAGFVAGCQAYKILNRISKIKG